MTLLELLVQELPKCGGWPEWAAAAVQNNGNGTYRVMFAGHGYNINPMTISHNIVGWGPTHRDGTWGKDSHGRDDFTASSLASDHMTRIVTREEYEQAVKPMTFEKVRSMLEDVVRQLTDATSVRLDNDGSLNLHFPAGYHVQTPLQRIEQLRKARDEAVRAYNDAFVSGEAELRKLKLGDKIILSAESDRYDGLIVKLVEISQKRDAIDGSVLYECLFVDSKGNDVRIDKYCEVRFAPL